MGGFLTKDPATSTVYYNDWTNYEDLRFPVTAINPPGAASDPDRDTTDGTLLFDDGSTEIIMGIAQMPHSWKSGTICPHVHWQATDGNTGDVLWRLEYQSASIGGDFSGSWTTLDKLAAAPGSANTHVMSEFAGINLTGLGLSGIVKWRISRIGGDASDDYGADAKLLEFDFHYEIESVGSGQEGYK